jgi:hypothetical protein
MRRGISLLEVLIATLVLAVALLALMGSGSTTHRHTHLLEEEVLAAVRARSLLDLVSRLEFERLDRLARRQAAADVVLDLDRLAAPGAVAASIAANEPAVSEPRARKVSGFDHRITYTRLDEDRGLVRVRVTWDRWGHHRTWCRLVVRPEASFRVRRIS